MKTKTTDEVFTAQQRAVIARDLKDQGASEKDIERFLLLCETTRLNPISRQIYARMQSISKEDAQGNVKWEKQIVIITSIDGLRAIAESTGEYAGQSGPFWCNKDGVWRDVWVGDSKSGPYAAKIGVVRKGFPEPVWGVARYDSFVQTTGKGENRKPNTFWYRMPDLMVAKCAEAGAIRRAFPQLLAGLYIEEEINENPDPEPLPEAPQPGKPVTPVTKPAAAQAPAPAPEPEAPTPEPASPPKKPANGKKTPAKAETAPEPAPAEENPDNAPETQSAGGWEDYVISQISVERYKGKRLGDLAPEDFVFIRKNWIDKNLEKFKTAPAKQHEADMINEGLAHHLALQPAE